MSDKGAILGILRNEDMHGYEISKRLKAIEGFWYIFPGNLYKALNSLLKENMIKAKRKEEHEGKIRKIYGITEKGKRELDKWLSEPAPMPRTRHEPFLKIWFSLGDCERTRIQIEQMRNSAKEMLEVLSKIDYSSAPKYIIWMMESGRKHMELDIEWAESCLNILSGECKDKER